MQTNKKEDKQINSYSCSHMMHTRFGEVCRKEKKGGEFGSGTKGVKSRRWQHVPSSFTPARLEITSYQLQSPLGEVHCAFRLTIWKTVFALASGSPLKSVARCLNSRTYSCTCDVQELHRNTASRRRIPAAALSAS